MNDNAGTKVTKSKEKEILIEISLEEEPENPYKNLGVIGECVWKWHKYFEWRKERQKSKRFRIK